MTEEQKHLNDIYDKNKPRLLMPIINTILGIGFSGVVLYLTIIQDLKIWVMILVFMLVIMFIASSWYNSYFSKRKMRKEIYNLQEEAMNIITNIKTKIITQIFKS